MYSEQEDKSDKMDTCKAIVCGERPVIPTEMDKSLATLVVECWSGEPDERPDISAVAAALVR